MNIPINGRIAIIDNEINEAMPLIKVLSKNRIPYVFYKGADLDYLPESDDQKFNDIRLIFLDINLLNSGTPTIREVKAVLYNVLSNIISIKNFPYSIIFWSKQEDEYSNAVKDLFENELADRKPINFIPFVKSDFFPNFGSEEQVTTINIMEEIEKNLSANLAYSHLLNWENQAHISADRTLQEVFTAYHTYDNWEENANYVISKLGESFSGRSNFKTLNPEQKVQNAFQAFNSVFNDTLEYSTSSSPIDNAKELTFDIKQINTDSTNLINTKLLFSVDKDPMEYSGAISEDTNPKSDKIFRDLLNNSFSRGSIEKEIRSLEENDKKSDKEIEKLTNREASKLRTQIRIDWKKIYLVVTPLCDFVQKKNINHRVIKGMMIKAELSEFIDDKSEAIFISPLFKYDEINYVIVLNFRYFFTSNDQKNIKYISPILRARHQLLAEIQSKLARHITRQGILFIE